MWNNRRRVKKIKIAFRSRPPFYVLRNRWRVFRLKYTPSTFENIKSINLVIIRPRFFFSVFYKAPLTCCKKQKLVIFSIFVQNKYGYDSINITANTLLLYILFLHRNPVVARFLIAAYIISVKTSYKTKKPTTRFHYPNRSLPPDNTADGVQSCAN